MAIEQAVAPLADSIDVNVASRRARIVWRQQRTPLSEILRTIAALKYLPRPVPLEALAGIDMRQRRSALWRMLVALLCMMQAMMYAVPRYTAGDEMPGEIVRLLVWAEMLLTVPVLVFSAGPFFQGAWRDLRGRRIGMDTPVALGIAVAFGASLLALGRGQDVYFDSVTMFIALLLVARWLETSARERATRGLADSLARLPQLVDLISPDGKLRQVSRRQLKPGDRLLVPAGATVPADATIVAGQTAVDESLLTGESRPRPRGVGAPVVAGSLNLQQPVEIVVDRLPVESRLAQLHQLVERASASKPSLLRTADRWARPFLAAILAVAACAWLGWWYVDPVRAPWIAASVLIVTCPCALALAAPSALLAAMGKLARHGIVAVDSDALEALARADIAVFDKTGTLTGETPTVIPAGTHGIDAQRALAVAAALERSSLHPVAQAFVAAAPAGEAPPEVRNLVELPGGGLSAEVMMDGRWTAASIAPRGDRFQLSLAGATARFELQETLRPDAAEVVGRLQRDGLICLLASGDHRQRVDAVAAAVGIDAADAMAACTPERKLKLVRAHQASGMRVMMVGDGINDAPVLRQADVSISFASAAPLAQHQADLLVVNGRLDSILQARSTARKALSIVSQSLRFSVAYNLVGIPLAIAGMMPPWLAGLGMACSSLLVVLNALRAGR
jgi:Cu2+-exporting ATPase